MRDLNRLRARRALACAGLVSLTTGLLLLPGTPHSAAQVTAEPAQVTTGHPAAASSSSSPHASGGSQVTVTGKNLWDPTANGGQGGPLPNPSTVTVSQTSELTDQLVHVTWTNFTPSFNKAGAGPYYNNDYYYAVMAVECKGTNPTSYADCYEADSEGQQMASGPSGPPNDTYAITTAQGTGQLNFEVETSLVNSVLGCDQNHPCSLVVVPGQGGVTDQSGQPVNCGDHSSDIGLVNGTGNAVALSTFDFTNSFSTGSCSWGDKLVIPLHFAPVPTGCPQRNAAFNVTGSPMMAVAMQQWLTYLCAGRNGMTIGYDSSLGEPAAVQDAVTATTDENGPGATNVALTTQPASADGVSTLSHPFVYAPIAVSAASIDYWIDDNLTGQPMFGLKLNQRLLAKLLTTSYNPDVGCQTQGQTNCDPGVDNNPFNILTDPEFGSLNPGFVQNTDYHTDQTYLTPTVPFGASDLTWTVTRWIAASSAASTFLSGHFDPWATHVNTYYLGTHYPVNQFQTGDPNYPWQQEYSPVSPLNLAVTYQALNEDAGSIVVPPPPLKGYTKDPPEQIGDRLLVAILDQGDAALNHFPAAAIENAAGKYVTPSNATMAAALGHMVSNGDGTVQMNLTNTDPNAYPLTMVIYAMVPASGLSHAKAAAIARFLDFAAGTGQRQGTLPGQLPPGYMPLPASMRAETRKLAVEVADQAGNHHGSGSNGGSTTSGPGSQPGSPGTSSPSSSPASGPGGNNPATNPAGTHPVTLVDAHTPSASISRFILPALLILGALAALGGSSALAGATDGGIPARLRRMRQVTAVKGRAIWTLARSGSRYPGQRRKP